MTQQSVRYASVRLHWICVTCVPLSRVLVLLSIFRRGEERERDIVRVLQCQITVGNDSGDADFYKERLGARERLETGEAKWLNYIMDRDAIDKFLKS
eukprot:COSAG02_NODE_4783_length_4984_cov_29.067086_1_plen_97_part_00